MFEVVFFFKVVFLYKVIFRCGGLFPTATNAILTWKSKLTLKLPMGSGCTHRFVSTANNFGKPFDSMKPSMKKLTMEKSRFFFKSKLSDKNVISFSFAWTWIENWYQSCQKCEMSFHTNQILYGFQYQWWNNLLHRNYFSIQFSVVDI